MPTSIVDQLRAWTLYALDHAPVDAEGLVALRAEVQRARVELAALADELERRALEVWPFGGGQIVTVPGEGSYTVGKTGEHVVWDHGRAALDVTKRAYDIGEIHHPADAAVVLTGAAAMDYWRLTRMRQLGLDPEQYREKTGGRLVIRPI